MQPDVPRGTDGGNFRTDGVRRTAEAFLLSTRRDAVLCGDPGFHFAAAGHGNGSEFSSADFVPGPGRGFIGFYHRRDHFNFPNSGFYSAGG